MKIRNGFISNSSSSSFICGICGNNFIDSEEFYGLEEQCAIYCKQGHSFCIHHLDEKFRNENSLIEIISEEFPSIKNINNDCKKSNFISYFVYNLPEKHCPICSLEDFNNIDFITYYLKKNNYSRKDIVEIFKKEFETYAALMEYLKKK